MKEKEKLIEGNLENLFESKPLLPKNSNTVLFDLSKQLENLRARVEARRRR